LVIFVIIREIRGETSLPMPAMMHHGIGGMPIVNSCAIIHADNQTVTVNDEEGFDHEETRDLR
jgi:hypothetical protein